MQRVLQNFPVFVAWRSCFRYQLVTLRVVVGPIARYRLVECGVQEDFSQRVAWLVLLIGLLLRVVIRGARCSAVGKPGRGTRGEVIRSCYLSVRSQKGSIGSVSVRVPWPPASPSFHHDSDRFPLDIPIPGCFGFSKR